MNICPHLATALALMKSTGRYSVSRIQRKDCKVAYAQVMLLYIDMLERSAWDLENTRKIYFDSSYDRQMILDHIARYGSSVLWLVIPNARYNVALTAKSHAEEVINSVYSRYVSGCEGHFDHISRNRVCHTYKDDEYFK